MNFLKNIFRMAMVAFATIAVTACSPDNGSSDDDSNMKVNPSWSVAYAGASEIEGVSYKHTAAVISTDENTYTVVVVRADEFQTSKLEAFGEALIQDMYAYLDNYNAMYGTEYVFGDMLDTGSTMVGLEDLFPDKYIIIALGITPEGELSGLYAASNPFEVKEEQPSALYSEWLGEWVYTGDNNKSNNVTLLQKVANRELYMSGLMGLPFSIVGEYSAERNDIIFWSQIVATDYTFSDGSVGDILLLGLDQDGKYYGLDNGNYGIAIAGVLENGYRAIVRYGVNQPGYPKFNAMFLTAYINGEYYDIGNNIPSFNDIAELAPVESTTNGATPMRYSIGMSLLPTATPQLRIGKQIESVRF